MTKERISLSGLRTELPDAESVRARNLEFVERVKAKPDFQGAVEHLNELSRTTSPMGLYSEPARQPVDPSLFVGPDVPIATLIRALTADKTERRDMLLWAYDLDVREPADQVAASLVVDAFEREAKRLGFGPGRALSLELFQSSLAEIARGAPGAIDALEAARRNRAEKPPPSMQEFFESAGRPVSPKMRVEELYRQYKVKERADINRQVFLAVADAIFEHAPRVEFQKDGLRAYVEQLGEHAPRLRADLDNEVDRIRRVEQLEARKREGEALKESGIVLGPPPGVRIADEAWTPEMLALAPQPQVIVEAAMELPKATRRTTQGKMRGGAPPPPPQPSADDTVIDKAPPAFEAAPLGPRKWNKPHGWQIVVPVALFVALVGLGLASWLTPKKPDGAMPKEIPTAGSGSAAATVQERASAAPAPIETHAVAAPLPSVTAEASGSPTPSSAPAESATASKPAPAQSSKAHPGPRSTEDFYPEPIHPPPTPVPSSTGAFNVFGP